MLRLVVLFDSLSQKEGKLHAPIRPRRKIAIKVFSQVVFDNFGGGGGASKDSEIDVRSQIGEIHIFLRSL